MVETILNIVMVAALVLFLIVAGVMYYQQWRNGTSAQRQALLDAAIRRLVDAAEQKWSKSPGAGQAKFAWVMGTLQKRFPMMDWDDLAERVEQAVLHYKGSQAARQSWHRNGTADK